MIAARQDDIIGRLQKDLGLVSLRALADLTHRLPLVPADDQIDAPLSEVKSKMFETSFGRFIAILDWAPREGEADGGGGGGGGAGSGSHHAMQYSSSLHQHLQLVQQHQQTTTAYTNAFAAAAAATTAAGAATNYKTVSELTITILSNMLGANIDVGLKQSLAMGYHKNPDIRVAFVRVLRNVLVDNTELGNLGDGSVLTRYDELLDALTREDMTLVRAMAAASPTSEMDELVISLLTVFEHRHKTFALLENLIRLEIDETDSESQLLRRSSVATKMLSVYARWKGSDYLKATLSKVLERLMMTPHDLNLELDPSRIESAEARQRNEAQLKIVTQKFLDDICASEPLVPDSFRVICHIVSWADNHDDGPTRVFPILCLVR